MNDRKEKKTEWTTGKKKKLNRRQERKKTEWTTGKKKN